MTQSDIIESAVGNTIDTYGDICTVVTQTATTGPDEYYQVPNRWVNSSTNQAHALFRPPIRRMTPFGIEWVDAEGGKMQETNLQSWFEATWTLEESQSGTTTLTWTRYKVNYNDTDYEIIINKPHSLQSNTFMKYVILKKITT